MHLRLEDLVAALSPALRRVHGEIGVAKQLITVRTREVECDPDAHSDEHLAASDLQRTPERGQHAFGDVRRLALVGEVLEQHCELVAAQAGGGVLDPEALAETIRHRDQQLVARGVTEAVVDRLEVVHVEKEDGQVAVVAAGPDDRVLDPIAEQDAVACDNTKLAVMEPPAKKKPPSATVMSAAEASVAAMFA